MNPHYLLVATRAGHRCEYCRAPEMVFNFGHEVEHVIPRSRGGPDQQANLALACRACNLRKSNYLSGEANEVGQATRLFNPRTDVGGDHFSFDVVTHEIHSKTLIGRATVARLQMNSAAQLAARANWLLLGLFP